MLSFVICKTFVIFDFINKSIVRSSNIYFVFK